LNQSDKLLKRLEQIQQKEGELVLVSIMILVGETGEPAYWFISEYNKAEG